MEKSCLILDNFSLTYRAFFGLPATIRTRNGEAINAVLGYYNTLSSLLNQIRPDYVVVASDCPTPTFRHTLFPSYKGQRPPMPEDLRPQLSLIKDVLRSCSIPVLESPGYEADDVIGTITANIPSSVHAYVVTTDRDALQLVSEQVSVLVPSSRENRIYTPDIVQREYSVAPEQIPDLKALMGDASDNIPGVPLVGPKTAKKWLFEYGSLERVLNKSHFLKGKAGDNLRTHADEARLYKTLATIERNVPLFVCWRSLELAIDGQSLRQTLESIGIRAPLPHTG